MSSQISRTYLLAQVPENIIENPDTLKPGQLHISRYNIAVWLNFSVIGQGPVRILVKYKDDNNEHVVEVDRATPQIPGQHLFSGVALLKCKGKIQSMQVLANSKIRALEFRVDEAFVERQTENQQKPLTFQDLQLGQRRA